MDRRSSNFIIIHLEFFRCVGNELMVKIIVIGMIPLLSGCTLLTDYPSDNFGEELIEEVIEYKTGKEVDLSPFSPEEEPKVSLFKW